MKVFFWIRELGKAHESRVVTTVTIFPATHPGLLVTEQPDAALPLVTVVGWTKKIWMPFYFHLHSDG